MPRAIHFTRMHIHAKKTACAHSCKYCSMGNKRLTRISNDRYASFIMRFLEWGEAKHMLPYPIEYTLNYSDDYDRATLEMLHMLKQRSDRKYPLGGITLGGLRCRSNEELRAWLVERQSFGCETVHASFVGNRETHDYWNGRSGNFDFIMATLSLAGELGMALGARLFVIKSTLASLNDLSEKLDRLPQHNDNWRYAQPFFYAGWASRFEEERIDEETRDSLPGWLAPLIQNGAQRDIWRSEREWIAHIQNINEHPTEVNLILNLTDENIDRLERMSCEAIVAEYEQRTRAAYAAVPSFHELCDLYGDKGGRHIYELERCIEMKWLDRHLAKHPLDFERELTHLQMGN